MVELKGSLTMDFYFVYGGWAMECGGARGGGVVEVEGKIFQTLGKSGSVFPQLISCASNRWISAMVIHIERTHTVRFLLSFFSLLLLILFCL